MKTPDGFTYVDPAQFHELFAGDLPGDKARFHGALAGSQLCGQFLSDNYHGCLENQTELDASSREAIEPSTRIWSVGMLIELIAT
ncbi:hypothetical protein RBB77_06015 [Tunturibacter psychrotolerans]|uniref:Uncharacterized protein n=1 Tax=Tunturiibacter psychrotolerans TaxID=3069686 RepID=A0AAU7ZU16_9BACT